MPTDQNIQGQDIQGQDIEELERFFQRSKTFFKNAVFHSVLLIMSHNPLTVHATESFDRAVGIWNSALQVLKDRGIKGDNAIKMCNDTYLNPLLTALRTDENFASSPFANVENFDQLKTIVWQWRVAAAMPAASAAASPASPASSVAHAASPAARAVVSHQGANVRRAQAPASSGCCVTM